MPQTRAMNPVRPSQAGQRAEPDIPPVTRPCAANDPAHSTVTETLNRHVALQLMLLHLPPSDIRYLCDVPEYFLKRILENLRLAQDGNRRAHKRHGGSSPGVWSLCYRPVTRVEAALFASDWLQLGMPFASRPEPTALCHALQRYRHWGWLDGRRQPLAPSACLALIRLVGSGELTLAACLLCRQPFVHPADRSPVATSRLCPFCGSPHAKASTLAADRRALIPC